MPDVEQQSDRRTDRAFADDLGPDDTGLDEPDALDLDPGDGMGTLIDVRRDDTTDKVRAGLAGINWAHLLRTQECLHLRAVRKAPVGTGN